jgi:hypothetical protein
MHYQSMQSQAREKHEQLRREAQIHRLAQKGRSDRRSALAAKLAGVIIGAPAVAIRNVAGQLSMSARHAGRFVRDRASAVHL